MAVKAEVEKLLAQITDAGKRAEATKMYEAHPFMQDAVLAQSDYSRKIQEADRKDKAATAKYDANLKWFDTSSKEVARVEAERDRLSAESQTLKAELDALKAGREEGSDEGISAAALAKYDSKIAVLEKNLADSKADTLTRKAYDEDLAKQGNSMATFLMETVEAKERHMKEFGTSLSKDDLWKFMNDNKIATVNEAYDRLTEDRRRTSWETNKEKEIEERIKKEISAQRLPFGDGAAPRGPLQQFLAKDTGIPEGVTADGSGKLASLAAQELRGEGKI